MQKIFREHSVAVLATLVIVFLAVMIGYYTWGVGYLLTSENKVEKQNATQTQIPEFNLEAAAQLDYRGTMSSSSGQ